MKQLFLSTALVCSTFMLSAQIQLQTEADARIGGTLSILEDVEINGRLEFDNFSVYIGDQSRSNGDNSFFNTFIGYRTGRLNTGTGNTFLGANSGSQNTEGNRNTFIGRNSGITNAEGDDNTFIGNSAGRENTTGSDNSMIGDRAGFDNTTGGLNAYFGALAGSGGTSGSRNVSIGGWSGRNIEDDFGNTLLGFDADKLSETGTLEKAIAIGYGAKVGCSNCAVIGGAGDDAVNVGMGINENLNARLSLFNNSNTNNPQLRLIEEAAGNFARLRFENTGQAGHWVLAARANAADDPRFNFFYNDGTTNFGNIISLNGTAFNVGMGTVSPDPNARLDVFGNIYINGAFHASDRRFKKNIRKIRQPMDLLGELRGVAYEFRVDEFAERRFTAGQHYGLIAQELETVLPELVRDREDGYKAVNYEGLIPLLIEGVKEQQSEIDELKNTVSRQEAQIERLTALVEHLLEKEADRTNEGQGASAPEQGTLGQNRPNPFHERTQVNYYIPATTRTAEVRITAADGKVLDRIDIDQRGTGQLDIRGNSYPAGTYFYSLILDGRVVDTRSMVLTR
jgi:uncharacterized coiled-coil protein SlyX